MELPVIVAVVATDKIDKKGLAPILIRVMYKRVRYKKATGFKVNPTQFSSETLIDSKVDNAGYKNNIIRKKIAELERAFIKHLEHSELSKDNIRIIVQGDESSGMSLEALKDAVVRHYINDLSKGTLTNWDKAVKKMNRYVSGIKVAHITPRLLKNFEGHMKTELGNSDNMIWSTMKDLRSIFSKAAKKDLALISYNPFTDTDIKSYKQPKRTFSTQSDIDLIEEYADNKKHNKTLRKVAAWYVMGAYSGLRYGDLAQWDEAKMVKDGRLYFSDAKTGTPHFIPLHPKLAQAIERVREFPGIMTNEASNRFLKDLGAYLEIDGKLNMHKARHTFAVSFMKNKGSVEVLQKLLGHKKISTTQIYGQIVDSRIEEEVQKAFGKVKPIKGKK